MKKIMYLVLAVLVTMMLGCTPTHYIKTVQEESDGKGNVKKTDIESVSQQDTTTKKIKLRKIEWE